MAKFAQFVSVLVVFAYVGASASAWAEDDSSDAPKAKGGVHFDQSLSAAEAYSRTQAVLTYFGVPPEPDSQLKLFPYQNLQTFECLQALLPYLDAGSQFSNYADPQATRMDVFQDPQSWQVPDFSVDLRLKGEPAPDDPFVTHLNTAKNNRSDRPLQGLRIALDPGHMGSDRWDMITGKWVQDAEGHKLSEGVINLQTALLLEHRLIELGAQVMLTHRSFRPVTDADYDTFDSHPLALKALREQSLEDWFLGLLGTAPIGAELFDAFSQSPDLQKTLSDERRETYFNDLDLQARIDVMEAFAPDLILNIHFDAAFNKVNPPPAFSHDATKVYVPGAFDPTELASRNDRLQLAEHLLDQATWNASVAFAHEIVGSLSTNLKLPLDKNSPGTVKLVEPGVFSRNLYVLKTHQMAAMAFAECAYYNDRGEFDLISNATHPMIIDGENHPYSDRIALVAEALEQGILQFVKKY